MVTFGSNPSLVCSRILSSGQSPSIPMPLIVILVVAGVVPVISLVVVIVATLIVVVATLIVVIATMIVVALPLSLVALGNSFSFGLQLLLH
ncbi:hypothetical protein Tco_1018922 [Tanacetum coccineum]|uniref:ABC transmembrane type-1 domain-containing protein n=1 Tax=Tanacetum coccineum TaxID=301880 RepID=A0ABQ5FVQ3_9ASTR